MSRAESMRTPLIHLSDSARQALEAAAREAGGEPSRIGISDRFEYNLAFGAAAPGDLEIDCGGFRIVLDAPSAQRADGLRIDFVTGPGGTGLTLENPNEPPRVRQISANELKDMMIRGAPFELIDVRTEKERATASIAGSRVLDQETHDYLLGLDRGAAIVFHCHFGGRSQSAAEYFRQQGFRSVYSLRGGIDAWSQLVDPSVPRY